MTRRDVASRALVAIDAEVHRRGNETGHENAEIEILEPPHLFANSHGKVDRLARALLVTCPSRYDRVTVRGRCGGRDDSGGRGE
jgi:hypothetical protein